MITKFFKRWWNRTKKSFIKYFPHSLLSLLLLPFFAWVMIGLIAHFGILAALGYVCSCLWNLDKLLQKVWRSIIWGIGYIFGAVAFGIILTSAIPEISKGDSVSIFGGVVIFVVMALIWLRGRQLRKK